MKYYIYMAQTDKTIIKIGMSSLTLSQRQATIRTFEPEAVILMGWCFDDIDKPTALLLESAVRFALAHSQYKSLQFTGQLDHFNNPRHVSVKNIYKIMDETLKVYASMYNLTTPHLKVTKYGKARM